MILTQSDWTSPMFLVKSKHYLFDIVAGLYGLCMGVEAVAEVPSLPALGVVADACVFFAVWLYSSIR